MDDKILIVSASRKSADAISQILRRFTWNNIDFASSGVETRRKTINSDYDLIIINSPLKDEQGNILAVDMINATQASIILIVKSNTFDIMASKVEGDGVCVVQKPLHQQNFFSAVRIGLAFRTRIKKLIAINSKYEKKYEELRVISRAKCMLVEKEKITEQEAHRYLEQQAMTKRESKVMIANEIIKRYL